MTIESIIKALDAEISQLRTVRKLLTAGGQSVPTQRSSTVETKLRPKRTLSKDAREKIAAAQRKRWAAQKKAKA
jgi:hypothetical protein